MEKNFDKKKSNKTFVVAVAVIIALVVAFLAGIFVVTNVSARARLSDKLEGFRELSGRDKMELFDPMYREGSFYGDVTVNIEEPYMSELAEKVLYFSKGASYLGTEESIVGNWDMSIVLRRADGGIFTVYLGEEGIYVAKDTKQYKFEVDKDKKQEYVELLAELGDMIAENAKK